MVDSYIVESIMMRNNVGIAEIYKIVSMRRIPDNIDDDGLLGNGQKIVVPPSSSGSAGDFKKISCC